MSGQIAAYPLILTTYPLLRENVEICVNIVTSDNIDYWRPHSATWENANYFKKYWIKKVVSAGKNISSLNRTGKDSFSSKLYSELFRGDVVQYGYGSDDMCHSQICHEYGTSSTGYNTLLMAQHTDNRKNIALHDYIQSTYYTYIRYYKMKETK